MSKKTVSASALAAALGISPGRVRQLHDAGVLPREGRNEYPLVESRRAYDAFKREANRSNESAYLDYLTKKNNLLELQNRIRKGDMIHRNDFCQSTGTIISAARARLLALPTRAAPLLVGCDDQRARQVIDRLVDEAIRELKVPDFKKIAIQRQREKKRG